MALIKYNDNSISAITTAGQLASGGMVLISEQTASSSSTVDFTSGIDSTYPIYKFEFINIHPATDDVDLTFQVDTGTNTNYNQTITSTTFQVYQPEDGSSNTLEYKTNRDQAQGTAFQPLCQDIGNANDESMSGYLQIFNPSSSTFVKHFIGLGTNVYSGDASIQIYSAGYINTTTAITRVRFKMDSGNIDSGTIKLYGIKDS
jgi:hypothetical protein